MLKKYITEGIHLGNELYVHNDLAIIPVYCNEVRPPDYITLKEALSNGSITVSEVCKCGIVQELKVVNSSSKTVLMLDGEEMQGAKQNRVLNTTVLLAGESSAIIPVSCSERGRWTYKTIHFQDSNIMMVRSIRQNKNMSISRSLSEGEGFRSNQCHIWQDIEILHTTCGTSSKTGAMKDAYEGSRSSVQQYVEAIPCQAGQNGMVILIKGHAVAFESVSRPEAYLHLHDKLIASYVMDMDQDQSDQVEPYLDEGYRFLEEISSAEEKSYKSVCLGDDHRYINHDISGSALVVDDNIIHLAFFQNEPHHIRRIKHMEKMAGMKTRRRFVAEQADLFDRKDAI